MGPGKFLELCVPNKVGSARCPRMGLFFLPDLGVPLPQTIDRRFFRRCQIGRIARNFRFADFVC